MEQLSNREKQLPASSDTEVTVSSRGNCRFPIVRILALGATVVILCSIVFSILNNLGPGEKVVLPPKVADPVPEMGRRAIKWMWYKLSVNPQYAVERNEAFCNTFSKDDISIPKDEFPKDGQVLDTVKQSFGFLPPPSDVSEYYGGYKYWFWVSRNYINGSKAMLIVLAQPVRDTPENRKKWLYLAQREGSGRAGDATFLTEEAAEKLAPILSGVTTLQECRKRTDDIFRIFGRDPETGKKVTKEEETWKEELRRRIEAVLPKVYEEIEQTRKCPDPAQLAQLWGEFLDVEGKELVTMEIVHPEKDRHWILWVTPTARFAVVSIDLRKKIYTASIKQRARVQMTDMDCPGFPPPKEKEEEIVPPPPPLEPSELMRQALDKLKEYKGNHAGEETPRSNKLKELLCQDPSTSLGVTAAQYGWIIQQQSGDSGGGDLWLCCYDANHLVGIINMSTKDAKPITGKRLMESAKRCSLSYERPKNVDSPNTPPFPWPPLRDTGLGTGGNNVRKPPPPPPPPPPPLTSELELIKPSELMRQALAKLKEYKGNHAGEETPRSNKLKKLLCQDSNSSLGVTAAQYGWIIQQQSGDSGKGDLWLCCYDDKYLVGIINMSTKGAKPITGEPLMESAKRRSLSYERPKNVDSPNTPPFPWPSLRDSGLGTGGNNVRKPTQGKTTSSGGGRSVPPSAASGSQDKGGSTPGNGAVKTPPADQQAPATDPSAKSTTTSSEESAVPESPSAASGSQDKGGSTPGNGAVKTPPPQLKPSELMRQALARLEGYKGNHADEETPRSNKLKKLLCQDSNSSLGVTAAQYGWIIQQQSGDSGKGDLWLCCYNDKYLVGIINMSTEGAKPITGKRLMESAKRRSLSYERPKNVDSPGSPSFPWPTPRSSGLESKGN